MITSLTMDSALTGCIRNRIVRWTRPPRNGLTAVALLVPQYYSHRTTNRYHSIALRRCLFCLNLHRDAVINHRGGRNRATKAECADAVQCLEAMIGSCTLPRSASFSWQSCSVGKHGSAMHLIVHSNPYSPCDPHPCSFVRLRRVPRLPLAARKIG